MKSRETINKFRAMKLIDLEKEKTVLKHEYTKTFLSIKAGKENKVSKAKEARLNLARLESIITEKRYGAEDETK